MQYESSKMTIKTTQINRLYKKNRKKIVSDLRYIEKYFIFATHKRSFCIISD